MNPSKYPTYRTFTGFFLPLAIQAASQALSYPLVAMVASRGPGGTVIFFPLSVALRAQSEGLAAWLKKPTTVLTGHALFLATITVAGFTLLILGTPGQVIGAVGLTIGSLASSATMRLL